MTPAPPPTQPSVQPSQLGFSLLEISVVMALSAMVTMGYLYNQSQDNQLSNAKVQAGYYLTVNDAVGKYMQTYYNDLTAIPPECSQVRLTAGGVPSAIGSGINCQFTSGNASGVKSPANALQPSVADLKKLAVLDSGFNDSFLWPTLSNVNAPKSSCTTDCLSGSNTAPAGFANRIQLWCNGSMLTSSAQGPCNVSMQLKSLTFNAQPFATANASGFFKLSRNDMLSTALNAVGSSGFMSLETVLDSEGKGKLYAVGKQTSLDNPVVFYDSNNPTNSANGVGLSGILAVQNAAEMRCSLQ